MVMGKDSRIEWTDHTVNFWFGCTKLTAACDFCYAEGWAKRSGMVEWGPGVPRRKSVSAVKMALKLDREAAAAGERRYVFCNSLSDFFDGEVDPAWRAEAWDTQRRTPNLDWLILTKRHHIAVNNLPERPMPNVRIGFTVENGKTAAMRLPDLATVAMAGWKTFISYEPALGLVDWGKWFEEYPGLFQWLICGEESGHHRRPLDENWPRAGRDACQAWGVPFFYKQRIIGGKKVGLPELDGRRWAEFPSENRTGEKP
jgi:protein gp37